MTARAREVDEERSRLDEGGMFADMALVIVAAFRSL